MYPPSASHQNGPIRNYTVSYTQGNEVITLYTHVSDAETYPLDISSQISVSSLLPYTEYTFTITATNDGGSSPSVTITARTYPAGKFNTDVDLWSLCQIQPQIGLLRELEAWSSMQFSNYS